MVDGDQIRTWDVGAQTWMLFTRGRWHVEGNGCRQCNAAAWHAFEFNELSAVAVGPEAVAPGSGIFLEFDSVTIDASPANGYEFIEWNGDVADCPSTYKSVGCRNGQRASCFRPLWSRRLGQLEDPSFWVDDRGRGPGGRCFNE